MDADRSDQSLFDSTIVRGLIAVGCLGVFFAVASVINPDRSDAGQAGLLIGDNNAPSNNAWSPTTSEPLTAIAPMGTLLGLKYTIEMFGTDQGTRYTVFDESGEMLVELATTTQVLQAIPDLDLEALKAQQMSEADTFDPMGGF